MNMPSSQTHSAHQIRISGACLACRAKKRKCSGEKPVCDQCNHSQLDCEWPRPQKRGLPKHLIRKLEGRLARMEAILQATLAFVSDDQLNSALVTVNQRLEDDNSPQDKSAADPETWRCYPLATIEDVRAWQNRPMDITSPRHHPDGEDISNGSPLDEESVPKSHIDADQRSRLGRTSVERAGHVVSAYTNAGPGPSQLSTSPSISRLDFSGDHDIEPTPNDKNNPGAMPVGLGESQSAQFKLPATFTKEFLW
ncbi:hypothetical protein GGR57DRAFT_65134 [Xylariaceae sp. FL1272]|nr:hypothetical protein GGR57DRAFT_65134 [Xylariaceae sp. FL1272]